MMNLKKNAGFLAAAGIVALLLAAAGVMVSHGSRTYSVQREAYQNALARFNELCQRDPFPSETNVAIELNNVAVLTNMVDRLIRDLQKGRIDAKNMAPEAFISHIQNMARNLSKRMGEGGVRLPAPNYDFDFDQYVSKGIPPDPAHIPGLNYQFELVNVICGIMADAKIAELRSVKRYKFDVSGASAASTTSSSRRGSRQSPAPAGQGAGAATNVSIESVPAGELFSKVHFSFSIVGSEDSIWTVLNQMAANSAFIVVSQFKLLNPKAAVSEIAFAAPPPAVGAAPAPGAQGPEAAAPEAPRLPRAERVVIGNELVEAEVELDVYRFASPESRGAGSSGGNGRLTPPGATP